MPYSIVDHRDQLSYNRCDRHRALGRTESHPAHFWSIVVGRFAVSCDNPDVALVDEGTLDSGRIVRFSCNSRGVRGVRDRRDISQSSFLGALRAAGLSLGTRIVLRWICYVAAVISKDKAGSLAGGIGYCSGHSAAILYRATLT